MTAIIEREYIELLRQNPPRIIRSDAEFDTFDVVVQSILESGEFLGEASAKYVRLVAILMEKYEADKVCTATADAS
jgi:hypothetical protein